jgi:3-phenylpropionate/cinnamic acid dioxygenase small subunit
MMMILCIHRLLLCPDRQWIGLCSFQQLDGQAIISWSSVGSDRFDERHRLTAQERRNWQLASRVKNSAGHEIAAATFKEGRHLNYRIVPEFRTGEQNAWIEPAEHPPWNDGHRIGSVQLSRKRDNMILAAA